MANKELSKQWFETGDYPTQAQFAQVFEWLRWKDEGISIADVAMLQSVLDSIQVTLNSILPNQLISGGNISIEVDDGTTLSIYLPETKYKLKGAPFTQAAGTFALALRPGTAGQFRIDVFYLDILGFHVVTGATSATPVKPSVPDGALELGNILIGFDNPLTIEPVPGIPDLSAVLAAGYTASKDIVLTPGPHNQMIGFKVGSDEIGYKVGMRQDADDDKGMLDFSNDGTIHTVLKATDPTDNRELLLPDSDGTLLTAADIATKADLVAGKVPASQLPSYVDDVVEYTNLAAFPATGEAGKIYVALDTNQTYRWTGSVYIKISSDIPAGGSDGQALIKNGSALNWGAFVPMHDAGVGRMPQLSGLQLNGLNSYGDFGYNIDKVVMQYYLGSGAPRVNMNGGVWRVWPTVADGYDQLQGFINRADDGDTLILESNKTYILKSSILITKSLRIVGGYNTVIKRADSSDITSTLTVAATSTDTSITVADGTKFREGDGVILNTGTKWNKGTTIRYVQSIVGNILTLNAAIGSTLDTLTSSFAIGTQVVNDCRLISVSIGNSYQNRVIFENITFDGNKANNDETYAYNVNNAIVSICNNRTDIVNCTFINSPSDAIVGHNLDVVNCVFKDNNGACIHLSLPKPQLDDDIKLRTNFIGNTSENSNIIDTADTGHSEGAITSSFSGGYINARFNRFIDIGNSAALFGATYPSTSSNDYGTNNVIITNNIIRNCLRLIYNYGASPGPHNVYIANNLLVNVGTIDLSAMPNDGSIYIEQTMPDEYDDSLVVHKAGTETITGTKTFTGTLNAQGNIINTSGNSFFVRNSSYANLGYQSPSQIGYTQRTKAIHDQGYGYQNGFKLDMTHVLFMADYPFDNTGSHPQSMKASTSYFELLASVMNLSAADIKMFGRMVLGSYTKAQRDAMTGVPTAALIYQTDNTPGIYFYNGTAWRLTQQASGLAANAVPYANGSGDIISDANFTYDGANLRVGDAGLGGSNALLLNGGRGTLTCAGGGFEFKVNGGSPADSSKAISFKNVTREWLNLYLPSGDAATTPLEGKASMNWSPGSNKSHNLGKSGTRWNKAYVGNVNAEIQTAPSSATDTGEAGEIRITSDYIYVCVATDTWKRSALSTW